MLRITLRMESDVEVHSLRERELLAVVDRDGLAAHVELPAVRARFAAAARVLLAAERTTDLRARRADVHVRDAAVGTGRTQELLGLQDVAREDRRRQALRHAVVDRNRLVDI